MEVKSLIRNTVSYDHGYYREMFSAAEEKRGLRVYIKSKLKVFEAVAAKEAVLERESFCAAKFTFTVIKDGVISFDQGDAISVKYNGEVIFTGFVFSKERTKDGLIRTEAYDGLRYLKNRRTYTRGRMTLDEIVSKICDDNNLRKGQIKKSSVTLAPMAAERISLLDVIKKAASETELRGGGKFYLIDDKGYVCLKSEEDMHTDMLISAHFAENFLYRDTIDDKVYNMVEVYSDKPKYNLRTVTTVSDSGTMKKWGTLILSKKAADPMNALEEAKGLLNKYSRVNRNIKIKGVSGRIDIFGGSGVYLSLAMGDLLTECAMKVEKAVHRFENNAYLMDIYLKGSD